MASSRLFPWSSLIQSIDEFLGSIHAKFSKAFSEGQDKPVRIEVVNKLTLFEEVWDLLETRRPEFLSLGELDRYFKNLTDTLQNYINSFCNLNEISNESISENKRNMLAQIVNLYYVLIRQKFILLQFEPGDEPENFDAYISTIKSGCEHNGNLLFSVDIDEIKLLKKTLDETFYIITSHLSSEKYLQQITCKFTGMNQINNEDPFLMQIKSALSKLPTHDSMCAVTKKCKEGSGEDKGKVEILEFMQAQKTVWETLNGLIIEKFNLYKKAFDNLTEKRNSIVADSEDARTNLRLLTIDRLLLTLNGYNETGELKKDYKQLLTEAATNVIAACSQQSSADSWTLGFWTTSWGQARTEIEKIFPELIKNLELFQKKYSNIMQVFKNLKMIRQRKSELDRIYARLTEKSDPEQYRTIWEKCFNGIQNIREEILASYLVFCGHSNNYIKQFCSDHWRKLAVGFAAGGTGGTALAVFLLTLEPVSIAILASTAAVAVMGAGAVIGMAEDQTCKRSRKKEPDLERQPLLNNDNLSNYTAITFWQGNDSRPDAPLEPQMKNQPGA